MRPARSIGDQFLTGANNLFSPRRSTRLARLCERVRRAQRLHGILGLLKLLPVNLAYALDLKRRRLRRSLDEFDRCYGVETAGYRSISTLNVPPEIAAHATRYEPIARLDTFLRALDIEFDDYTFIDYGCGKGRALLMASNFPFRRIIGVEYSAELAAIARRNIAFYRNDSQKCRAITVVEGDAAAFQPPDGPSVYFLHNPFDGVILGEVLRRIGQIGPAQQQDRYLVYVDPQHRQTVDANPDWEIAADYRSWVVYLRRAPAG
jgi:SAM-dependent methyltransferase